MITGSNNGGPNIRTLTQSKDLENVPVVQLQQLKAQLLTDMEILEKVSSLLVYKEGGDTTGLPFHRRKATGNPPSPLEVLATMIF